MSNGYTKAHKETVNRRVLARNKKGTEIVLAEKPVITLDKNQTVVKVILNNKIVKKNNWREYLPFTRYDLNFKKIK